MKKKMIPFLVLASLLVGCEDNKPSDSPSSEEIKATATEKVTIETTENITTDRVSSEITTDSIISTENKSDTQMTETILSISDIKRTEVGKEVYSKMQVISKTAEGFYGKDETGFIFVYLGKDGDFSNIQEGNIIKVHGYSSLYNFSHQISPTTDSNDVTHPVEIEKLEEKELSLSFSPKTIDEMLDTDNEDVDFYGTPVSIKGHLTYTGTYQAPYSITVDGNESISIARATIDNLNLRPLEGKLISLEGFVYCYLSNTYVVTAKSATALSAADISDEEAIASASYYLKNVINGSKTADDFTLIKEYLGATITYTSSHPEILDENGHYNAPTVGTDITFTATITRGSVTVQVTFVITALKLSEKKVVISESYTAGGNSKAIYNSDFVELYNQTNDPIDLSTYSLQKSSTGKTSKFTVYKLSGTIAPHDYFLIRGQIKTTYEQPTLEEYDLFLDKFDAAASDYILALANDQAQITYTYDTVRSTLTSTNVIDLLGAGKATLFEGSASCSIKDNTKSLQRIDPTIDTDDNVEDFKVDTPTPRKSAAK